MVDKINGVGQSTGAESPRNKGVKLSDLQQVNNKLYEYFKNQNLKDDSVILLSDIESLKSKADKNENGKVSAKEVKKIGIEGSRKERKAFAASLDSASNKIKQSEIFAEKVDDYTTDFYQNDIRVKTVQKDKDFERSISYEKDGKTPKEVVEEKFVNDEHVKIKTVYNKGNKNYADIETDKEKVTQIYNPSNDKFLSKTVKVLKSDPNSTVTTSYEHGSGCRERKP